MKALFTKPSAQNPDICEVFFGDPEGEAELLGTVAQVIGSNNRPTGSWAYALPNGKMNWRAGHSRREAAFKLAKKHGLEITPKGD